ENDRQKSKTVSYLKSVLLVGNHLSGVGMSRGVGEDLAEQLTALGWQVTTASDKLGRFVRLLDMILTTWHHRQQYVTAQVDVFSCSGLLWTEVLAELFR